MALPPRGALSHCPPSSSRHAAIPDIFSLSSLSLCTWPLVRVRLSVVYLISWTLSSREAGELFVFLVVTYCVQ